MLMTEARKLPDHQRTAVHKALFHDSAAKHVCGTAVYVDDIPEPPGTLHAAFVLSPFAHARVDRIDVAKARRSSGIVAIMTAQDIPGENDIAPLSSGEPLFADKLVEYAGQPLAAIAARNQGEARTAAKLVELDTEPLKPVLTISEAMEQRSFLVPPMTIERGNVIEALAAAPERVQGTISIGGQEHFYLEGQVAIAIPGEDRDLTIYSATQNPTEVQHICSRLVGIPFNRITTVVRRLGGGFGGKESNASWVAGAAALLAWKTKRPVKLSLPREIDMLVTGKRHGFLVQYEAGFDHQGRILAFDVKLAANGGHSTDHTPSVLTKALTHVDNCYWIADFRAMGYACKTNTVSNTAFRGYGAPQAVVVMEDVIDQVAHRLAKSREEIRAINFYRAPACNEAPYGQKITENAA